MWAVDQEHLHDPEKGVRGDCMRAVLASIFELSPYEVPHFDTGDSDDFWTAVQRFCNIRGYVYVEMGPGLKPMVWGDVDVEVWSAISGPSPRDPGVRHVVVGLNGVPHHDPHPSRQFLAGSPEHWVHYYLVPLAQTLNRGQNEVDRERTWAGIHP